MPYLNVNEVESALQVAANQYSFIQRFQLPNQTWQSRTCHAVKIANGGSSGRVGVYFVGGVHAREWVCPDTLIYFVEQLAQAYQNNTGITLGGKSFTAAQIKSIVDKLDLFVFPQANPDGRHHSMTSDSWWRKNRRPAPGGSGCLGVDINRNCDFLWNYTNYFAPTAGVMNSKSPCDSTYIGPSAASEPETRNVVWVMNNYPHIRFFVDVHSYSELILHNWGDDENQAADQAMNFKNSAYNSQRGIGGDSAYKEYFNTKDQTLVVNLANRMRNAIQAVRGRTYTVQQSFTLYPTAGTTTDYATSRCYVDPSKEKVNAYTLECGTTFFPPDAERQQIIREVTAGLLDFCLGVLDMPADIYIRDNLQDTGEEPLIGGGIARSPDINHYRQQLANPQVTLGSTTAQNQDNLFEDIEFGQANYIYVRLQNRGCKSNNAEIDVYWTRPSTLPTPASWNLIGTLNAPSIAPGECKVVGPLVWNSVPAPGHYCFVAVLGNTQDPKPNINTISSASDFYTFIRQNNNVTWKNFDVYDLFAGGFMQFNFLIQGWPRISYFSDLEIDLGELPQGAQAKLKILKRLTSGAAIESLDVTKQTQLYTHYEATSQQAALRNMPLKTSDSTQVTLSITLPEEVPDGVYDIAVLQKIEGREMGRVTRRLLVGDYPYVANRNTEEVHEANCEWVAKMSAKNKVAYRQLELALQHGYNGCRYCLKEFDTD